MCLLLVQVEAKSRDMPIAQAVQTFSDGYLCDSAHHHTVTLAANV